MPFVNAPPSFDDLVVCSLSIKVGTGTAHEIKAGSIKQIIIHYHATYAGE